MGIPERLAEGAANGQESSIMRRAAGWDGIRTATVDNPALTSFGTASVFLKIMVNGPGQ